jgi:hypothetical protein
MNGPEHYRRAELLLESCQTGTEPDGTEFYPSTERLEDDDPDVNTIGNALLAAHVHATLALAAAQMDLVGATVNGVVSAGWSEVLR